MQLFTGLAQMREPSWYILTHCVLIACAMLASALVVLVWAGKPSVGNSFLQSYASHTATMAYVVFAAGGVGAVLMEDILRR